MTRSLVSCVGEYARSQWREILPSQPQPRRIHVLKYGASRPVAGKITLFFLADGAQRPSLVAKLPRDQVGAAAIQNEWSALQTCDKALSATAKAALPLPAHLARIQGRPILMAPFLKGKSLRWLCPPRTDRSRAQLIRGAARAMQWLAAFHLETGGHDARFDQTLIEELTEPLRRPELRHRLAPSTVATLDRATVEVERLEAAQIPTAMAHGDFVPLNILLHKRQIHVVDWEWSQAQSLALADALLLPTVMAVLLDRTRRATIETRVGAYQAAFFQQSWFAEAWRGILAEYCQRLELDIALLPIIYPSVLADMATRDERTVGVASGTDRMFEALLSAYLAHMLPRKGAALWPHQ